MTNNKYFEMVASDKVIAKATIEYHIDLFDVNTGAFLRTLNTIYDSGGNRIAINDESKFIVIGSYYDGLEVFDINNGEKIWGNNELHGVQKVAISENNGVIHVLTESSEMIRLTLSTGRIITNESDIANFFLTNDNTIIVQKESRLYHDNGRERKVIYESDGYILDVKSYNGYSIISEMYQSLIKLDNDSQKIIWKSDLAKGFVINKISHKSDSKIYVFAKYTLESGNENYLITINERTGHVEDKVVLKFKGDTFCFSNDGYFFFSSNGDKINL